MELQAEIGVQKAAPDLLNKARQLVESAAVMRVADGAPEAPEPSHAFQSRGSYLKCWGHPGVHH